MSLSLTRLNQEPNSFIFEEEAEEGVAEPQGVLVIYQGSPALSSARDRPLTLLVKF